MKAKRKEREELEDGDLEASGSGARIVVVCPIRPSSVSFVGSNETERKSLIGSILYFVCFVWFGCLLRRNNPPTKLFHNYENG